MENKKQIVSIERVRDSGEVLTNEREVEAMLNLVKDEVERIDSKFLEPACGDGNFLIAILKRKLNIAKKYKNKNDFEKFSLLGLSSIYGIDLLIDNVEESRKRLLVYFEEFYRKNFTEIDEEIIKSAKFILNRNIIQGDSLNGVNKIIFTNFSLINNDFKLEEYKFSDMNEENQLIALPLFGIANENNKNVFVPKPIKTYNLINFKELYKI